MSQAQQSGRKILLFDSLEEANRTVSLLKVVKVRVDGVMLCLTRTNEGFFAFESSCPHMSVDLGKAPINPFHEVVCPWHAYRFSLRSGEEAENRCRDLHRYELSWEEEKLFIWL